MRKLRIGDKVKVIAGNSKGSEGKITSILKDNTYVIVEGVNKVKKHVRKGILGQNAAGTIVEIDSPIHVSNVMLVCPHCGKLTKVKIEKDNNKKYRVCKKCGKIIDAKVSSSKAKKPKKTSKSTKKDK